LKFTIITRYYHPTPDGIAHHSAYLHQYLVADGHSVQVIYDDGIISLQENEIGILVNKIKRHQSNWVIFQYNGYSYNRFGAPSWLSKLFKRITTTDHTKLCIIVHETYIRKDKAIKLKIYRHLQKRALRIATKHANLIITTTHLYQEQLNLIGRKSELFFTPSNFENYIKGLFEVKQHNEKLRLGTFGNRDPKFLLQIVEKLEQKGLSFEFDFIGNYQPQYIKEIKNYSKKLKTIQIERSGKLTDRNIVLRMGRLDAFILLEPVREDGGGGLNTKSGSSATALCMGIPIFSTIGDFTNPKVFLQNENYISLDYMDYEKSANILYSYLNNKEDLITIGKAGQLMYHKDFSWEQYAAKLLKLMN